MNKTGLSNLKPNNNKTTIEPMIKGYYKWERIDISLEQT